MIAGSVDGTTIRALRIELMIRQVELARLADISGFYLRSIELHGVQPSEIVARRIARALNVNVTQLLTRKNAA